VERRNSRSTHAQAEDYFYDRQFDKAIEVEKKLLAENPTFAAAYGGLGYSYWGQRKYSEAIETYKISGRLADDKNLSEIAVAMDEGYRYGKWPGALHKAIEVSLAQRKANTEYVSPYGIAQYYADLGDKDHAFEWLNTAYQEHDISLFVLRTDFTMDSLRSDPRYAEMLKKIGLPQ
jgi:adenylate cyclase